MQSSEEGYHLSIYFAFLLENVSFLFEFVHALSFPTSMSPILLKNDSAVSYPKWCVKFFEVADVERSS